MRSKHGNNHSGEMDENLDRTTEEQHTSALSISDSLWFSLCSIHRNLFNFNVVFTVGIVVCAYVLFGENKTVAFPKEKLTNIQVCML